MQADGRTDRQMMKLIVTIRSFANAAKSHTKNIWVKKEDMPGENRTHDNLFITNMG